MVNDKIIYREAAIVIKECQSMLLMLLSSDNDVSVVTVSEITCSIGKLLATLCNVGIMEPNQLRPMEPNRHVTH